MCLSHIDTTATSTEALHIETDAGDAFIKAMGNKLGPHAMAKEFVATSLANWFGLPTFEYAIMVFSGEIELPLRNGRYAKPGPAFATKAEKGETWGSTSLELNDIINPSDITRIVVFDTWVLNCDRHPPNTETRRPNYDNVFLKYVDDKQTKKELIAMDHTHCFVCGDDINGKVNKIGNIKDNRIYGLFHEFEPHLNDVVVDKSLDDLSKLTKDTIQNIVSLVPKQWEVYGEASEALIALILDRSTYMIECFRSNLASHLSSKRGSSYGH